MNRNVFEKVGSWAVRKGVKYDSKQIPSRHLPSQS